MANLPCSLYTYVYIFHVDDLVIPLIQNWHPATQSQQTTQLLNSAVDPSDVFWAPIGCWVDPCDVKEPRHSLVMTESPYLGYHWPRVMVIMYLLLPLVAGDGRYIPVSNWLQRATQVFLVHTSEYMPSCSFFIRAHMLHVGRSIYRCWCASAALAELRQCYWPLHNRMLAFMLRK